MDPSPLKARPELSHVYVLKSEIADKFYIGFTANFEERLGAHNKGDSYWTKRFKPWKLIYCESYISSEDARTREKQLKRYAKGFAQLKRRLQNTLSFQR